MRPRPPRHLPAAVLLATLACSGVAAAQAERVTALSPFVRSLVLLLTTLVVGGLTVAVAPRFTERTVDSIREEPLPALLVGVAVLVAEFVVVFVAALFGPLVILVLIPLAILGAVTQAVGVVALGCVVVDEFDEATVWTGLGVGAALCALAVFVPLVGQLLWFVVGVVGLGAVVRDQFLS
ncbi:MAG: hypothetical protein ACOCS7_01660 [Halolamina sp.]